MANFEFLLKKRYTSKRDRGSWIAGSLMMYKSLFASGFAYDIKQVAEVEKQILSKNPAYRSDRAKLGVMIADVIDGVSKVEAVTEPAPKPVKPRKQQAK